MIRSQTALGGIFGEQSDTPEQECRFFLQISVHQTDDQPMAPTVAESFLLSLIGVVDAKVWEANGTLVSRVVVLADSGWTGSDLQLACIRKLGEESTPKLILLSQVHNRLAAA